MTRECRGEVGHHVVLDLGIEEPDRQVLRARAGGDDVSPGQLFVLDIPEPAHVAPVGGSGVDGKNDSTPGCERERLGPAGGILREQEPGGGGAEGRRRVPAARLLLAKNPAGWAEALPLATR